MLLNTDVGFNAEGAKVTKAGEMAIADFIRRSVVRVGLEGHTVMNVHRSDNGFPPESRRERGVNKHCACHCEDGTDG